MSLTLNTTHSPRLLMVFLSDAARSHPSYSLRVTAAVPPSRLPGVSGAVSGEFVRMGSLITLRTDEGLLVEDIRPEWVNAVEVV